MQRRVIYIGLLVLMVMAGCRALTVPEPPPKPDPSRPVWQVDELEAHLRLFNSIETRGRATGTQGYATAAAYAAARLREFGLQPAVGSDFRTIYHTGLNYPTAAALYALGTDTLAYLPGIDFLPDGRSDAGDWLVRDVAVLDSPRVMASVPAVMLPSDYADTVSLQQMAEAGTHVVFLIGPLVPNRAAAPVSNLVIVQLAPEVAAELMGQAAGDDLFAATGDERFLSLTRPLRIQVATTYEPQAGAVNLMGIIPGKHPVRAKELVIICADLDAMGVYAGISTFDFSHLGVGSAALLEVSRAYAHFAHYFAVPERSILFAFWSGARTGHAGLKSYLKHPVWALDHTQSLIYVGLSPEDTAAVQALIEPYDIRLEYLVLPPDSLPESRVHLQLPLATRRTAQGREQGYTEAPLPEMNVVFTQAAQQAEVLAQHAHASLMRRASSAQAYPLVEPDTASAAQQ